MVKGIFKKYLKTIKIVQLNGASVAPRLKTWFYYLKVSGLRSRNTSENLNSE